MFLALFDFNNRKLRYVNAGHSPTILLNQGDLLKLDIGCTIIGAFDTLPKISVGEIILDKNAILLAYTDGLTELENDNGEMFGFDKLCNIVLKNEQESMEILLQNLTNTLHTFKGEQNFNDDVSVLACKIY